jgi:hypothetical protein
MSNEFKNEIFTSFVPNPARMCNQCGEKPAAVQTILDPTTGRTFRMFKCKCGEQTWSED